MKLGNLALEYVLKHSSPNMPEEALAKFHEFVVMDDEHDLMHVGDKKAKIIDAEILKKQPKNGLELGTFLGYSGIRFANLFPENSKLYRSTLFPKPTRSRRNSRSIAA